ncbi:MAG TPA: hypothetical protein VGC76_08535 [Pyrinomonadaceae bacterium]
MIVKLIFVYKKESQERRFQRRRFAGLIALFRRRKDLALKENDFEFIKIALNQREINFLPLEAETAKIFSAKRNKTSENRPCLMCLFFDIGRGKSQENEKRMVKNEKLKNKNPSSTFH